MNVMIRKLIILLLAVLLPAGVLLAAPVSAGQARQKAMQFLQRQTVTGARRQAPAPQQLRLAATGPEDSYYLFCAPAGEGFVVVSGDDATEPILGYSHTDTLNPDSLPCGMKVLLDGYARQIADIRALGQTDGSQAQARSSAAPSSFTLPGDQLTTYYQRDPYYLQCPTINGDTCYTGCVATAMAGLMYYHQWPKAISTSIPAYISDTLKLSVSGIPAGTPINWAKIQQHYTPGETSEEGREDIATLMKMAGASVRMNYKENESSAYGHTVPYALKQYFSYGTAVYEESSRYKSTEWIEKLRKEISENGPILYGGNCINRIKENGDTVFGGHAFLLEGYDANGYFNVNLCGGEASQKFLLTVTPDNPFVYLYRQAAVLGVRPGNPLDNVPVSLRLWTNAFSPRNDDIYKRSATTGDFENIDLHYVLYNFMPVSHEWSTSSENIYDWGVTFRKQGKGQYEPCKLLSGNQKIRLAMGVTSNSDDAFSYGNGLTDGQYDVFMVSRESGKDEWCLNDNSQHAFAKAWVCGDYMTFKSPRSHAAQLSVQNVTQTGGDALTVGSEATFTYQVSNSIAPAIYDGAILVKLVWHDDYGQQQGKVLAINEMHVNGAETRQFSFSFTPDVAGDMELQFLDRCWNVIYTHNIKVKSTGDTPDDPDDPNAPALTDHTLKYWFDGQQELAGTLTNIDGAFQIDVSALSDGLHTLHVAVGAVGSENEYFEEASRTVYFEKRGDETQIRNRFYVDNVATTIVSSSSDNSYTLALPVENVGEGLHQLTAIVETPEGGRPIIASGYFQRVPTTAERLEMGIDYWLNGDYETREHVVASMAGAGQEEVEAWLPVRRMPLRTGNFLFDIEQGVAVTYAVNDISLQATTYFGPTGVNAGQYIDTPSRTPVSSMLLPADKAVTQAAPAANTLQWYHLTANRGDIIGLKASRPCTLRLFSPAAEEVYTAKGSKATAVGECQAQQSGTFYLALYDPTDGEGQANITVSYYNAKGTFKGDVNGDGDVDIADAVCIVNHVVGKSNTTFNEAAADANGDGDIDIADAVHIVNYVVGKIQALAPRRERYLPDPE